MFYTPRLTFTLPPAVSISVKTIKRLNVYIAYSSSWLFDLTINTIRKIYSGHIVIKMDSQIGFSARIFGNFVRANTSKNN